MGKPLKTSWAQAAPYVNAGLNTAYMASDYNKYRKNHYGRGGAFATAATYAAVGSASGFAGQQVASTIKFTGKHAGKKVFATSLAAGIIINTGADALITRRVERHFDPAQQRNKLFYTRRVKGKVQRVRKGRR